jgi:hypothetical protein
MLLDMHAQTLRRHVITIILLLGASGWVVHEYGVAVAIVSAVTISAMVIAPLFLYKFGLSVYAVSILIAFGLLSIAGNPKMLILAAPINLLATLAYFLGRHPKP